jgi:hypothetical protein
MKPLIYCYYYQTSTSATHVKMGNELIFFPLGYAWYNYTWNAFRILSDGVKKGERWKIE